MSIFGRNSSTGIAALECSTDTMWAGKFTLIENGTVSRMDAYLIRGNANNAKLLIYDDGGAGGKPGTLKGYTNTIALPVEGGTNWYGAEMTTPLSLPAGDYWLTAVGDEDSGPDLRADVGSGLISKQVGSNFYAAPPNPWGEEDGSVVANPSIYATYEAGAGTYPVGLLKKGLVSGFHCFMSGYLSAKVAEKDPLKLPDGTPF